MILTKSEILKGIEEGQISIQPFQEHLLNPNSYNVRLGPKLRVYEVDKSNVLTRSLRGVLGSRLSDFLRLPPSELDSRQEPLYYDIEIPPEGFVCQPGTLYLGHTEEITYASHHVMLYEGRSTTGRLGVESHICAGWGDVGFKGQWTLEIRVMYPTRIYTGMEIGQIAFFEAKGDIEPYGSESFRSRYQNQTGPVPSRGYLNVLS